ncbi:uncharacterized protein [Symphalangus syndactylus]|uniref:uncharacterized protein isoform X1 n=2 Tax=Symphalangus syndactylus TaxID=9590 RepID=UPI003004571F
MESRPSRRQHASEGDGDQSPTQCAGMRSSGRSDQPYVLRGKPLPLRVRCYSGCASGSRRQSQLSAIINTEDFSDRMCGGSSGRKPGRRFLWPSRHQVLAPNGCPPIQCQHCLPEDSVRSHRLGAQSLRLPSPHQILVASQPPELLTNRLQVGVPTAPSSGLNNLLEWLLELRETLVFTGLS